MTRDGDDFAGLREYVHGDPPRHVHWKAAASHNDLLTKQFSGEGSEEIWLTWGAAPGTVESRLSQLSKWVTAAESSGLRYGLSIPGKERQPARGPAHYHDCLRALALWGISD